MSGRYVSNPGNYDDGQSVDRFLTDQQGRLLTGGSGGSAFDLLNNASATGAQVGPLPGGDYIWRVEGTFGGTTATLQYLGLDGVTWIDAADSSAAVADLTANGQIGVGIGQGAIVRVELAGGTPSAMFSNLAGLG